MQSGFIFCGTNVADLGLEYAPEIEDTYVYQPGETEVHDETFDGHNGGYYYGAFRKPKEFTLRCYFEEKQIDQGFLAKVLNLFKVGRSGKLIFTRRPWCYYMATVTENPDLSELTNYMNGVITIHMKAYYPYALCDSFLHLRTDKFHPQAAKNTALFDKEGMAPTLTYKNITAKKTIYLPNPGTERAAVGIGIAGEVGQGVKIINKTTDQICGFVAVSKAKTTSAGKYVYTDGYNGRTVLTDGTTSANAFLFHDYGFIEMEPCYPAVRELYINYNGNTITVSNILHENLVGQFIFAGNAWRKITSQSGHTLTAEELSGSGTLSTMVIKMNEIVIEPVSTMSIDTLTFNYKPTFA